MCVTLINIGAPPDTLIAPDTRFLMDHTGDITFEVYPVTHICLGTAQPEATAHSTTLSALTVPNDHALVILFVYALPADTHPVPDQGTDVISVVDIWKVLHTLLYHYSPVVSPQRLGSNSAL